MYQTNKLDMLKTRQLGEPACGDRDPGSHRTSPVGMETRTACPNTPAVEVPQVQPVGLFSAVTKPGVFSLLFTWALPVFSCLGFCGGQRGPLRFLSCVN